MGTGDKEKAHLDGLEGLADHTNASSQWGSGYRSRELCNIIYKRYYADSLNGVETDYDVILDLADEQQKKEEAE